MRISNLKFLWSMISLSPFLDFVGSLIFVVYHLTPNIFFKKKYAEKNKGSRIN